MCQSIGTLTDGDYTIALQAPGYRTLNVPVHAVNPAGGCCGLFVESKANVQPNGCCGFTTDLTLNLQPTAPRPRAAAPGCSS
jgi:hypothetical protein